MDIGKEIAIVTWEEDEFGFIRELPVDEPEEDIPTLEPEEVPEEEEVTV
jgi:hypothetical protein